jgi:hypothetical protein
MSPRLRAVPVTDWLNPWHHNDRVAVELAMRWAARRIWSASMPHTVAARSGGQSTATAAASSKPAVCSWT